MDPVVMIALEVGTTKEKLVGKYSGGKLSVELEKPAQFGKLSDLLEQYNVPVASWPKFLQDALSVEAWLWALDYATRAIGTTKDTKLTSTNVALASNGDFPTELDGAELELDSSDSSGTRYLVKKDGAALKYTATKSGDTYSIEANVYKFLIQGLYQEALTIIKGMLALKSIAFGITNDPTIDAAEFEKACRKVLDAAHGPKELSGGN